MPFSKNLRRLSLVSCAALFGASPVVVRAELVVVATDAKTTLANGAQVVRPNAGPDTLAVIDLAGGIPRLIAEIDGVPATVIGPPAIVAVTPDEQLALVACGRRIDPANPTRQIADNRLTVVDLTTKPPTVIATLETGRTPSGVAINRQGNLALVGNQTDGTLSIFGIEGKTVTSLGTVKIAEPAAGVRQPVFTPDGKRVLVTRDGDNSVMVLNVDGTKITPAGSNIRSGLKPYVIDINRAGTLAVVSNVGYLTGDTDTIGVIDLASKPPRAVDIIGVGQTPESLRLSPDGTLCGVVLTNGSAKPATFPFYSPQGKLLLFRVEGTKLTKVAEAPIGGWPQSVVISRDNRTILASSMTEQCIHVFKWDGTTLRDTGQPIKLRGGPAAMGTAVK